MNLGERLEKIEEVINQEEFIRNKGLGNEVGYYVFSYPAQEELKVRAYIQKLLEKQEREDKHYIKHFDLYDIMIDFIEKEGFIRDCYQMEQEDGLDYLISAVVELMEKKPGKDILTNFILDEYKRHEKDKDGNVFFLSGVGKIFPFVRSHNILNRLHPVFDKVPVVLFYPGKFDGQSMILFGEFMDNNYYRAFPLVTDNERLKR